MSIIKETYEFEIFDHLVLYIGNADLSGCEQPDIDMVDEIEQVCNELVKESNGSNYTIQYPEDIDDAKEFKPYNSFSNLGGNVIPIKVHIF